MRKLILLGLVIAVSATTGAQVSEITMEFLKSEPEMYKTVKRTAYDKFVRESTIAFEIDRQLRAYTVLMALPKLDSNRVKKLILIHSLEFNYDRNEYALQKFQHFSYIKIDWRLILRRYRAEGN